jgi:hypothetical protein
MPNLSNLVFPKKCSEVIMANERPGCPFSAFVQVCLRLPYRLRCPFSAGSLHDAMDDLLANRASEGDRLRVLLGEQVAELEAWVDQAAEKAQERLPQVKERLQNKVLVTL